MAPRGVVKPELSHILDDAFVVYVPADIALTTRLRKGVARVLEGLEAIDQRFGRVFGAFVVAVAVLQGLFGETWGEDLRKLLDRFASALAVLLLIVWLLGKAAERHLALTLNERLGALRRRARKWTFQAWWYRRFEQGRIDRRRVKERGNPTFLVSVASLPPEWRERVVNDAAMLAYNRWPHNARLTARKRFFGIIAARLPSRFWVGFEYEASSRELSIFGYAAIVALHPSKCNLHREGEVNLFTQTEDFFLSERDVEAVAAAQRAAPRSPAQSEQLAFYVLGMNVRGGLERTHGIPLLDHVKAEVRRLLREFPRRQPFLYCASTIPGVLKSLDRLGFKYCGRTDILGNKLYEFDPDEVLQS